jgi:hypothetical protein
VYYLVRPKDPTRAWKPVKLHHEPVTHRMRWVRAGDKYQLVVLPLHGRGNKGGAGRGVKVFAYEMPSNPEKQPWKLALVDSSMHLTHNLDVVPGKDQDVLYIGGKEGIKAFVFQKNKWSASKARMLIDGRSFGEIRSDGTGKMMAGIEPMHGNELTVYTSKDKQLVSSSDPDNLQRTVLTPALNQGHALAVADVLGTGKQQVVAGWREPDKVGKVGVKIFDQDGAQWSSYWIDENGMACEDLQVADLDGDGKPDIIAAGRATKNLKIYWNRN